ncbi:hypothetical protein ACWDBW_02235 [Streptomyces sp. NPDC001107]
MGVMCSQARSTPMPKVREEGVQLEIVPDATHREGVAHAGAGVQDEWLVVEHGGRLPEPGDTL